MVHPGIIVASVFGVVVTGVVIYTIIKEEFFEQPSSTNYERFRENHRQQQRQQQQQEEEDQDRYNFYSSSTSIHGDYELRQRRIPQPEDDENEKSKLDNDLMQRLQRVEAEEARLAEKERAMREREENLQRSMREHEERLEREMRESFVLRERRDEEEEEDEDEQLAKTLRQREPHISPPTISEIYQNPFASHEPLIQNYNVTDSQESIDYHHTSPSAATESTTTAIETTAPQSGVSSRAANAILRHDLSSSHHENINPFEDPSTLLENLSSSSDRSSVHGHGRMNGDVFADSEDRSVTVDRDDEEDFEWTEAEIGSIGSQESDESWVSH